MADFENSGFPDFQTLKKRSRRLQLILFLISTALTAGIILLSINSYRFREQGARVKIEQQLQSVGTLKAAELSKWYRERHGDAEVLKNIPGLPILLQNAVQSSADKNAISELRAFMETYITEYDDYDSLVVADPAGLTYLSVPADYDLTPLDPDLKEGLAKAFETGQVVFIDFYTRAGEPQRKIYLSLIVPFYMVDDPGQPLSAVIMNICPEMYLFPLVMTWPVEMETAESLLVRQDGDHVLFLNPLRFDAEAALNRRISLEETEVLAVKAVKGQTGTLEGLDYRKQPVVGSINPVPGTPWFMVSRIDKSEFMIPIRVEQQRTVFTAAALLILAFAIISIVWRGQQLSHLRVVTDINRELERRVAERTNLLQAANEELDAFAYSVSHDLRAPLRAMSGFATALQEEFNPHFDERGNHYIERIQAAAGRMGDLIDDLLSLSKVTRVDLKYGRVDLSKITAAVLSSLQQAEPQRKVEARIAGGMTARGDENLLYLALENLVSNAWKFSAPQPLSRIEVGVRSEAGKDVFYVRDNGVGFDMAFADKLFTPFQRLHGNNEFPGTGIGLAIVQRVINRHGGRVWAEAVVNQGASFYFTLPA